MRHVIYLTGAPATGKSTLTKRLQALLPELFIFSYADELAAYISKRQKIDHFGIREHSAKIVTRADVDAVDSLLLESVSSLRNSRHVIIDSHPITIEEYGFRATPFTVERLRQLNPTLIFCLFADPQVIRQRIADESLGRPQVSEFQSDFHTHLQASVAFTYGFSLGIPTYYLDGQKSTDSLAEMVISKIR